MCKGLVRRYSGLYPSPSGALNWFPLVLECGESGSLPSRESLNQFSRSTLQPNDRTVSRIAILEAGRDPCALGHKSRSLMDSALEVLATLLVIASS